jgi:hypothetical protein
MPLVVQLNEPELGSRGCGEYRDILLEKVCWPAPVNSRVSDTGIAGGMLFIFEWDAKLLRISSPTAWRMYAFAALQS